MGVKSKTGDAYGRQLRVAGVLGSDGFLAWAEWGGVSVRFNWCGKPNPENKGVFLHVMFDRGSDRVRVIDWWPSSGRWCCLNGEQGNDGDPESVLRRAIDLKSEV